MIRFYRSLVILYSFLKFGIGAGIISFFIFPYIKLTIPKERQMFAYANVIHKAWQYFTQSIQDNGLLNITFQNKDVLENLSGKIVVANHPTFIDIIVLISAIPNAVCLAKKETLKNPLFRNIVKSVYIINDIDLELLKKESDALLKKGFNIVIFPTGTRTKPDEELKLHKGSAVISLNSNAGIIPVKITTDYPFLQKGQPIYDIGDRVVHFNLEVKEEISPENFSRLPEIKARKALMDRIKFAIQ